MNRERDQIITLSLPPPRSAYHSPKSQFRHEEDSSIYGNRPSCIGRGDYRRSGPGPDEEHLF
jgi:hypothetical protein